MDNLGWLFELRPVLLTFYSAVDCGGNGGLVLHKSSIISPDNRVFELVAVEQYRCC